MKRSRSNSPDLSQAEEITDVMTEGRCNTEVKVKKFYNSWIIDNFSSYIENGSDFIESPVFSCGGIDGWSLILFLDNIPGESEDYLPLFLFYDGKHKVRAKVNFYVLNADNKAALTVENKKVYDFVLGAHAQWRFLKKSALFHEANGLLPDNNLILKWEIATTQDTVWTSSQYIRKKVKVPECQLSAELGRLWEKSDYADCCLCVDGQEFLAHKVILAAHSPVFRAMFQHEMKEKQMNRVEIVDVHPDIFKEMLRYIYTGKTPNLDETAYDLLTAADMYLLEDLKVTCESAVCRNLTVENAAAIYALGDLHGITRLKAYSLYFISKNTSEVMATSGWNYLEMHQPHLAGEAFIYLILAHCQCLTPRRKKQKI